MKWMIDDIGSYDRVYIREAERPSKGEIHSPICIVFGPTQAFDTPTDADREEMLATAREIVEAHNAKEE